MKTTATRNQGAQPEAAKKTDGPEPGVRVHPVVIYPFRQPSDYSDLDALYRLIAKLDADKDNYARPITVMDRKTHHAMAGDKSFLDFKRDTVGRHSEILDAWCVDTCQMWYSGLGRAFEQGGAEDVYWLIPGDFDYGTPVGKEVLGHLHKLPEVVLGQGQDLCIGEIAAGDGDSKRLIDTYGTFALLYSWFPAEAQKIRQHTDRPRSEFFAIRHSFLQEVLRQRWYAHEQTLVMLLQAVFSNKEIHRVFLGDISDLPQGRESFASATLQIQRTERVLGTVWLERNQSRAGWAEEYRALESQSDQIRRSALIVLESVLG